MPIIRSSRLYFCHSMWRRLRCSSGSHAGLWFAGSNPAEAVGFFLCTKSSACLPPEGTLNNLSHVPTLRHVKEPSNCGKLRIFSKIPSIKKFPPSLAEGSHAVWCDGASGDEWGNYVRGRVQSTLKVAVPKDPAKRPLTFNVVTACGV
jgi:hypothetical protein